MSTVLSAIGCFRYLTGRGNIRSKMHLVGKTSVRHLFGRGIVNWGRVWTENCLSRFFLVRKMSIGKVLHGVIPSVICLVVNGLRVIVCRGSDHRRSVHHGSASRRKCSSGKCLNTGKTSSWWKNSPKNFAKLIFPLTKNKYIQDFIILLKNKTERLICRKSTTTINLICKKY